MADPFSQFQGTQSDDKNSSGPSLEQSQAQHPDLQNLSSARSYANLKYLFGVQDPAMLVPKTGRNRRKSTQGSEQVKHRRTRSGCYTCRGRRVKCDEKHPICERCRKGNRECKYPETATSTKATGNVVKSDPNSTQQSPGSSSEEYEADDDDDAGQLESIIDEEDMLEGVKRPRNLSRRRNPELSRRQQKGSTRNSSETPSLDKGPSPSPSTEGSVGYHGNAGLSNLKLGTGSLSFESRRKTWAHLPEDLQYYLSWFYENVTCQHYSMKHDPANFLKTIYLDQALKNEALLNGIVGFTAFQHTLRYPNTKMLFLQYYNKAVSLLLRSLKQRGHRHSIGTLLTILQLATIEEYLGDWINLLGHQKAAFEILTYLYTPETVVHTEIGRCVLKWYSRFDVFGSLMGGFETVLSREWFSAARQYFLAKGREEPENLDLKIDAANSRLKLIGMDMSVLFNMIGKGLISKEEFIIKNQELAKEIADWKESIDPAIQDPRYLVTDYSNAPPLDPQSIVNPYRPGILYGGPLWAINISTIDWYALDLMHQYQTALILGTSGPNHALTRRAFCTCELFEAIENWPGSPKGSVIGAQASLGIASLFLPRDARHSMWVRRKFATIESNGYIYPLTFRTKMSALFQDQSCMHWWLPNEENFTPIVRAIRSFVESRTTQAIDVSQTTEDLSNMKAIFSNMKLDDGDEDRRGSGSGTTSSLTYPSPATSNSVPPNIKMEDDGGDEGGRGRSCGEDVNASRGLVLGRKGVIDNGQVGNWEEYNINQGPGIDMIPETIRGMGLGVGVRMEMGAPRLSEMQRNEWGVETGVLDGGYWNQGQEGRAHNPNLQYDYP